jgi:endonuclease/exonuclease/phosphatase family metal-dependent hydrolase
MRFPRLLGLLVTVLANSTPSNPRRPNSGPVRLRVVSYNIQAGRDTSRLLDLDRTARAIEEQRPDIAVLQELDVHWSPRSDHADQAQWLARRLDMAVYFAPIYTLAPERPGAPERQFGLAIMSRHPILQTHNHSLTRLSTQVPNPTPESSPGFPEVLIDVNGQHVWVYGCHLDYRPAPTVRHKQVAEMRAIMEGREGPRILCGDFNAIPDAPELAPLWGGSLQYTDALAVVGQQCEPTYPTDHPSHRFDYVLASPQIDVTGAWISSARASDHLPVVADLSIPRRLS